MSLWKRLVAACGLLLAMLGSTAHATPLLFQAHGLAALGAQVVLALDFIDGDGASNQLSTYGYSSDGSLHLHALSGAVSGDPSGTLRLQDTSFFNEALLQLSLVDRLRFHLDATAVAPVPGAFADAFSLFLLDPVSGQSLIQTDDPSGANALLMFVIDGSGAGQLQTYRPQTTLDIGWSLVPDDVKSLPEPGVLGLILLALLLGTGRRLRLGGAMLLVLGLLSGAAQASDLSTSVQLSRSGFVLNRSSNTYDTAVTVTNKSAEPLLGPLWLVLDSATPVNVALYNSYGRTASGSDYLVLPLNNGQLAPGASVSSTVKLLNTGQAVVQAQFSVQGERLSANASTTLNIAAAYAAGPNGDQVGASVGAGWQVRVDGVVRGLTDAAGKLSVQVPVSAGLVGVGRAPNWGGSTLLPSLAAGQTRAVQVLVEDGKEIVADGVLRFDQVQQLLLPRNAARISLRFVQNEQPVRLSSVNWVSLKTVTGNQFDLSSLFSVQSDGSLAASAAAFMQALAGKSGKLSITVDANDDSGQVFDGSVVFHLADYRVRVQLVAPPSNPGLPLAGVRLSGAVLNSDIRFQAQSDANGYIVLPDLPAGNLSLNASTTANGIVHAGIGTAAITQHALVKLTLRGPKDVLNNVPPVAVEPLPPGALAQPGLNGLAAPAGEPRSVFTPAELQARTQLALSRKALPMKRLKPNAAGQASVSAVAAAKDLLVQDSAQLLVKKGSKKVTLKYSAATAEYPYYVLQQSVYNDVWSVSVLGADGSTLFEITRQINSQLSQEPVWQGNGSTGEIKREIDVTALAAAADTTLIVRATAVNIGDSALATAANASLEAVEPLVINTITPSAMPANTANDGSFYSIPRSGGGNTMARSFALDITKPTGATITGVSLELRDGSDAALMTVVQEGAPGSADITVVSDSDTHTELRVRGTISNPASTIAGTPPPTRDLNYHFVVKGKDAQGNDIQDEKDASGKRALWRMPDGLGRYGGRDAGGDDWASRGTYNWLSANSGLLREINDISGEHGRNLGHNTHAHGNDIDMFHFYLFPGTTTAVGGGALNHSSLFSDVQLSFQTIGTQNPPAAATAALARVQAWLTATRDGLTAIAARPEVSQVIHCSGLAGNGLAAGWCNALLRTGRVTRTVTLPNVPPQVQTLNVAGAYTNTKMANNDVHNDHIHITLNPGQIGE